MKTLTPRRFVGQLLRPHRGMLAAGSLVLVAGTAVTLSLPMFLKNIFDSALQSKDPAQLARFSLWMMGAVVVLVALTMLRTHFIFATAARFSPALRQRLMRHVLGLDMAWFEVTSPGEVISRIHEDVRMVTDSIVTILPILVRGTLLGIGSLFLLAHTSLELTSVLVLAGIPIGVVGWWLGRQIKVVSRHQQMMLGKVSAAVSETVGMIAAVRVFGQQRRMLAHFAGLTEAYAGDVVRKGYLNAALLGVNLLIGFAALTGVLWLGGLQVMAGGMTMGSMLAFLLYLSFLADAVGNYGNFWPVWQSTMAAAERILDVMQVRAEVVEPKTPARLPRLGRGRARAVAFEGVRFAYPSRPGGWAADGVDLRVKAGQKAAIVGPSGAGKTTLFGLMLRFYDVAGGHVRIDGVDVRELAFAQLRESVAVVAQEPAIFSATVRENVAYGKPGATEREVWAALKVANADGFVKDLPEGLETAVGERGLQLSGGQRQRLAIARAVLVDAPVLLLDEATSHLDAESERAVQEALERAGQGRTVITIAHRLSTVRAADVIYVMDKGRVVASGDHATLMKKSPLYRALASLQMA